MEGTQESFYSRPMVRRLTEIFDNPAKPATVTQQQFDNFDDDLFVTSQKAWHEIDQSDYWHYLLDLCYVSLQQDLFDYLFPAFLIKWWEGQVSRFGGPDSECDLYRAIDHGRIFETMMDPIRRQQVYDWMVDAYMDGLYEWSGELTTEYESNGPNNLHGPIWSFWALGQSVPILDSIIAKLEKVSHLGIAQWWLVLRTGIAYNENEGPKVLRWNPNGGGGGVYLLDSSAAIYDHGLINANWSAVKKRLSGEYIIQKIDDSMEVLECSDYAAWANDVRSVLAGDKTRTGRRCELLVSFLMAPDLGDSIRNPLDK